MLWLIFALGTALVDGIRATIAKHAVKEVDEYVATWAQRALAIPVAAVLIWLGGIPEFSTRLLMAMGFGLISLSVAGTLYMKALKLSPLYLTMPYLALTPLFMLVTSLVMVGEFPDTTGLIGIVSIVVGVYFLHLGRGQRRWWEPFAALRKEKGSMLMLIVAFIFSIGSNLDKIAVQESSPLFYSGAMMIAFSFVYVPVMMRMSRKPLRQIAEHWKPLMWLTIAHTVLIVLQMSAVNIGLVTYVISIKRLSILVAVVLGALLFREKGLRQHIIAAGLMVLGAILIAF